LLTCGPGAGDAKATRA